MPTILELITNVSNSYNSVGTAASYRLTTNMAWLSAQIAYNMALTDYQNNQNSTTAAALLSANSVWISAQDADVAANASYETARTQLRSDLAALATVLSQ